MVPGAHQKTFEDFVMQWLKQKQSERRWWTGSAIVAMLGLVLGVVGVIPALADFEPGTCSLAETETGVTLTLELTRSRGHGFV